MHLPRESVMNELDVVNVAGFGKPHRDSVTPRRKTRPRTNLGENMRRNLMAIATKLGRVQCAQKSQIPVHFQQPAAILTRLEHGPA